MGESARGEGGAALGERVRGEEVAVGGERKRETTGWAWRNRPISNASAAARDVVSELVDALRHEPHGRTARA